MKRNPFLIKGPASLSFSGGRTSAYMLRRILDAHNNQLPPEVHVCFQNTGAEREETLDFVHAIETRWQVPVVWLEYCETFDIVDYMREAGKLSMRPRKHDRPRFKIVDYRTASRQAEPFKMMIEYYHQYRTQVKGELPILPNPAMRICTDRLKIKTNTRFMQSCGYEDFDVLLGIRKDEPNRWINMMGANDRGENPFTNVCPLYDAGITKADIHAYWQASPFDLQLDPQSDEGNCTLCFLKKCSKIIKIMEQREDLDDFWLWAEDRTGTVFRRDRPSYHELRRMIREQDPALERWKRTRETRRVDCICGEGEDS